jgi:adenylate kinase
MMEVGSTHLPVRTYTRKLFILSLTLFFLISGFVIETMAEETPGPYLVLIGAPAAGKTTNGNYISEKYGIPTIDVRKILQDEIAKASESKRPPGSGKPGSRRSNAWSERQRSMHEAMKKLEKGELVKDDVLNTSVLMRLLEDDCRNGFVLDGYPGSVEQAIYLDGLLAARGVDSLQVILLDISDEFALEKMARRGRPQDKDGFAEKRLELYRANIGPVLDYYQGDSMHVIDASTDLASIQEAIDHILGQ